jgi:putative transposase
MPNYFVRKLKIGKTEQLDKLARAAGKLYTRTLVSYWRVVRKKKIFLSQYTMEKWHTSPDLHSQSCNVVTKNVFAAIKSAQKRKKAGDKAAKYPKRHKKFYKINWRSAAIHLKDGKLILSNGNNNRL